MAFISLSLVGFFLLSWCKNALCLKWDQLPLLNRLFESNTDAISSISLVPKSRNNLRLGFNDLSSIIVESRWKIVSKKSDASHFNAELVEKITTALPFPLLDITVLKTSCPSNNAKDSKYGECEVTIVFTAAATLTTSLTTLEDSLQSTNSPTHVTGSPESDIVGLELISLTQLLHNTKNIISSLATNETSLPLNSSNHTDSSWKPGTTVTSNVHHGRLSDLLVLVIAIVIPFGLVGLMVGGFICWLWVRKHKRQLRMIWMLSPIHATIFTEKKHHQQEPVPPPPPSSPPSM